MLQFFFTKVKHKIFLFLPNIYSFYILIKNLTNLNFTSKKKKLNDFIDIEKNKIGLCLAHGPSLIPYLQNLEDLAKNSKNKYCLFSVNKFEEQFHLDIDYRIISNDVLSVINNFKLYNNSKTTLFYSDSVDCTNSFVANKLLKISYLTFDQRHFKNAKCNPVANCCNKIINDNLTIQEELVNYTGSNEPYSSGSTVSLHMLAFSILLGCKTIYIFGVDLNYNLGYINKNINNPDSFDSYLSSILNDFKIINNMAKNIGVKIFSTCKNSPINDIFEYNDNPFT
jgi:hypothetical protein